MTVSIIGSKYTLSSVRGRGDLRGCFRAWDAVDEFTPPQDENCGFVAAHGRGRPFRQQYPKRKNNPAFTTRHGNWQTTGVVWTSDRVIMDQMFLFR
jgi:hypothetical protein